MFKFCQKPIILLSASWVAVLILGSFLFLAKTGVNEVLAETMVECQCQEGQNNFYVKDCEECDFRCQASGGVSICRSEGPTGCGDGPSCVYPEICDNGQCVIRDYEAPPEPDVESSDTSGLRISTPSSDTEGLSSSKGKGLDNVSLPNFIGVTSISELILKIVRFLMALAIPFAIFMLVWAGFLFATAQGSEEKINTAKRNLIWTVVGIAVILASEVIVDYISEILGAGGAGRGSALMNRIKTVLNGITVLLFVLVTVYFGWGVVKYVRAAGDEKAIAEGKKHMLWGIIGMAVMAGAWGIVRIIQEFVK